MGSVESVGYSWDTYCCLFGASVVVVVVVHYDFERTVVNQSYVAGSHATLAKSHGGQLFLE